MKILFVSALVIAAAAHLAVAGDRKPLPNQAGNDNIELSGTIVFNPIEVKQVIGGDPGPNILVVKLKAGPKNEQTLRIGPDDFELIYRKDGQKSEAMMPTQIAGKGALVIKAAPEDNGWAGQGNGHGWVGIGGIRTGGGNSDSSNSNKKTKSTPAADTKDADAKDSDSADKAGENPLVDSLQSKMLEDKETKDPIEGLLYFAIDGKKLKAKDFSLIYKGPGGRLVMDFQ